VRLILVTGGARSGKSRFAQEIARREGGDDVTFIATAVITDAEMELRIARHRADRPDAWRTIEAPAGAAHAIGSATSRVVLLDCLTFVVSNALLAHESAGRDAAAAAAQREVDALLKTASARDGLLIIVTNEVGSGIVPVNALARLFRDAAGHANQRVARAAAEVHFLVSGIPVRLAP
jgi:adenosyl cobinamide kinase/adenosyl cobinamide phosphate guanylyltransferase